MYNVFVLSLKSMDSLSPDTITDQDIRAFQEDGAICLRDVFTQKWIDVLRRGIEFNRLHPSEMARRKGHTHLFFHDYGNWDGIPEYKEFIFQSPVGEIAARLLQSSVRDLWRLLASADKSWPNGVSSRSNLGLLASPFSQGFATVKKEKNR